MLTAMFLAPEQDVAGQLERPTAKRLIQSGAKLYTLGDKAALSIIPLAGWSKGSVRIVSRQRAIVDIAQESPCAA